MLNSKSSGRRYGLLTRVVAVAFGVSALTMGVPTAAHAEPVTIVPGLPPVEVPELEIPEIPGLPNQPEQQPAPPTPERTTPPSTTPAAPASPQIPDVATQTGYIALADDATKQITWWKDGEVVRTMPISMGSDRFPTPNGTYHTMEKYRDMYMDSSTFGVPIDSPDGYRTYVEYAVRMSWSGIFIHAAPWSVQQQGHTNVSRGCINVSTENGKWIYENIPRNTPIVVRGTIGGTYVPGS